VSAPRQPESTRVVLRDVTAQDHADAGTPPELPLGSETIGRHRLIGVLGRGGMGIVYEAHDPALDRRVAIKLVRAGRLSASLDAGQRLVREAQAIARLSHPNVVEVYEIGRHGDRLFIAMELIEGTSLRRWLADAPRARDEILAVLRQCGEGLAAAHRAGIVHRDFKPDNVMVSPGGRVRVLDFGLALPGEPTSGASEEPMLGGDERLTQTGTAMGTPAYMAPEQFVGGDVDARTDQFAFCIVAVEALSGRRPFEGESLDELARHTSRTKMDPLAWKDVPHGLARVLRRGLSAKREDRWPDMEALLAALPGRRTWWAAAAIAGAVAAVTVVAWTTEAAIECTSEAELRASVWGDDARARVHAAIVGTGVTHAQPTWDRVRTELDERVDRWAVATGAACRAGGAITAGEPACLEQRAVAIAAAVEALAGTDRATVHNAVRVVATLPDVEACLGRASGLVVESTAAADARGRLAAALALEALGRYPEAIAELDAAPELGDAPDPDGVAAQMQRARGRIARGAGDGLAAARAFERAYFAAMHAGRDDIAVLAAAELAAEGAVGYRDRWQWAGHAKAGLARAGGRDTAAAYDRAMCTLQRDSGALDDAVEHCKRALAETERADDVAIDERVAALRALADVRTAADDLGTARDLYARALETSEHAWGSEHPSVADALDDLTRAELALGHQDLARELGGRALAVRERLSAEEDDPRLARTWSSIASIDFAQQKYAAAREGFAKSLALQRRVLGDSHPDTAATWHELALAQEEVGEKSAALASMAQAAAIEEQLHPLDIARIPTLRELARMAFEYGAGPTAGREHLERAWDIVRASGVPDSHPLVKDLDHGYGETLLALGRPAEAVPYLERYVADPRPSDILPHVQFVLARALWAVHERDRAIELVESARTAWSAPSNRFQRDQIGAMQLWLGSEHARDDWNEDVGWWSTK
jgi:tetratricopeptide (TPR) repeat protein/predicted Ser/Thr protein kinase